MPIRHSSRLALLAAATILTPPALAQGPADAPQSVPVPKLVSGVTIPHSMFRLENGLTVIVHEDHKAPVVAVSVWYNVGSKDEPKSKTGFAHLFEHIMYNGTENLPGDFFNYLQQIGATDYNGTTYFDRTNYFQTVPTGALERALFMESDRMGHLLGAVSQQVLDTQRAVVQNEKRQSDSRPGGLVQYEIFSNLFPQGHPYHHLTIGSMADLDAASLADVKQWFRDKYGPNNAVLVLAGDVTEAQARPLVEKYFGPIARGPVNRPAMASVPTLPKPKSVEMKDAVATVAIQRFWPVPGLLDRQLVALDVGGSVLGGLASSRLDRILVRDEKIAVGVTAGLIPLQRVGIFTVTASVKPGVDPALVSRRLDEVVAEFMKEGPTEDEVQRAVMSEVSSRVRGLEQVGGFGGKAVTLAEGQTYAKDSNFYKKTLAEYAAITPAAVRSAMRQWLRRPALTITLSPGEREAYTDAKAVAEADAAKAKPAAPAAAPKRAIPPVGQLAALDFPTITHTRLSNGIALDYVQRSAVPVSLVAMAFDAGSAADTPQTHGLASMTMDLLDEGTAKLSSQEFAEAEERLGANVSSSNGGDRSYVSVNALSANLGPSLDLLRDTVTDAAFRAGDIDRIRTQKLTGIEQLKKDPTRVAHRLLPTVLYGAGHPYAGPAGGDLKAITAFTREDLVAFRQRWLRPDNAKLFVVSDRPLAEVQALLEARFGNWKPAAVPKGVKNFAAQPPRVTSPRILLINRPGAPQASIVGAQLLPIDPKSDIVPFDTANDVLGGTFLSRLNMDLRETKGWSYGVSGDASVVEHAVPYMVSAPVQADRTGDALVALQQQMRDFLTSKGVTQEEIERTVANSVNRLPGQFETSGAVLNALMTMDVLDRPDDYYEGLAAKYRTQTPASLDRAARSALDLNRFIWIVVGDAAKLRPQLDKLGMPIEMAEAP